MSAKNLFGTEDNDHDMMSLTATQEEVITSEPSSMSSSSGLGNMSHLTTYTSSPHDTLKSIEPLKLGKNRLIKKSQS